MSRNRISYGLVLVASALTLAACGGSDDPAPATVNGGNGNAGNDGNPGNGGAGGDPSGAAGDPNGAAGDPNGGNAGTDGAGGTVNPGGGPGHLKLTFSEGRLNLNEANTAAGNTLGVQLIDSSLKDAPAVFETADGWDSSTGVINAPKEALKFPSKQITVAVTNPLPTTAQVTVEFSVLDAITGTYNEGTGQLDLQFNAQAMIDVSAMGIVKMKCNVTPIPLRLSSGGGTLVDPGDASLKPARPAQNWAAAPFLSQGGGDPQGAISYLWDALPASTKLEESMPGLATCKGTLDPMLAGKGGLWLGGTATK